jgi:AraC-like DNA-binding protein
MSFDPIFQGSTVSAPLSAFSQVVTFDSATLPTVIADLLAGARAAARQDRVAAEQRLRQAMDLIQDEARRLFDDTAPPTPARGGLAAWQKRRIDAHIAANLHGALKVSDLATLAKLSASYFSKAFAQSYGQGAREYIIQQRLERAREMMLRSQEPLGQIAAACGFADQAHLSTRFRKAFAMSPHAWRRSSQHEAAPLAAAA